MLYFLSYQLEYYTVIVINNVHTNFRERTGKQLGVTAAVAISQLKSIFAYYGIPNTVV